MTEISTAAESLASHDHVVADASAPADPFAADWRVLLPAPAGGIYESLLLFGGSPELAKLLIEIGLTREVILRLPCERPVDAVVLLSGAMVTPADIVDCAASGAVLYWEIDQLAIASLRARSGSVQELLHDCGFSDMTMYRARPSFQNCESYLPLGARNAERWYSRERQSGPAFPLRLLRHYAFRIPFPRVRRTVSWNPSCDAVVAVRGETQRGLVSRGILGRLPAQVLQRATRLLVLKRRGRRGRDRRLVVFAFSSSDPQPIGVLKVSRTARHRSRIEAEQSALVSIRGLLDDELKASLPEPLGCFESGASVIGVESYLAGRPRARGFRERRRQFDLAASWIARFHSQMEVSRGPWDLTEIGTWIEKPIAAYRREFGAGDDENRLFELLLAIGRSLCGESLPLVWCHGDFNESNIFYTQESLRVVDWEAATVGLPLFDLLFFVMSWSYRSEGLTDPAERLRRFREIILGHRAQDEISRVVWRAIDDYVVRLGIDRRFVPLLLALHWIVRGSPEHVRCLAEGCDRLVCEAEA